MSVDHYLKTAVAVAVGVFLGMAAYDEAASEQILGPVAMLVAVLLGAALVIGGWDPKPADKKQASAE